METQPTTNGYYDAMLPIMSVPSLQLLILQAAVILVFFVHQSNGDIIISGNGQIEGGKFRYFFNNRTRACTNVILLGVGTGMTTADYNLVSKEMVQQGNEILAIVTDHTPGFVFKNSKKDYIKVTNAIVANLHSLIPICDNAYSTTTTTRMMISSQKKIIVAGHSASGGTAWNCLFQLAFRPDGFLGLDPFQLDPHATTQLRIPSLNIGFSETTCLVTVDDAAKASYETSGKDHRVLYLINNTSSSESNHGVNSKDDTTTFANSSGPTTGHCSFTDRGCFGPICPVRVGDAWVRASVGFSIRAFVQSLWTGVYHKQDYILPRSYPTTKAGAAPALYGLYVNEDQVV